MAVGKPRDAALAAAIADYESRAARYWPLDIVEVRDGTGGKGHSDAAQVQAREGVRIREAAAGARLILCDERGEAMDSLTFARFMQARREEGADVAFVVGGAFGLAADLRAAAWRQLALAPWTLPHELARLVLAEQLYRAGTIVRREPYHKL